MRVYPPSPYLDSNQIWNPNLNPNFDHRIALFGFKSAWSIYAPESTPESTHCCSRHLTAGPPDSAPDQNQMAKKVSTRLLHFLHVMFKNLSVCLTLNNSFPTCINRVAYFANQNRICQNVFCVLITCGLKKFQASKSSGGSRSWLCFKL